MVLRLGVVIARAFMATLEAMLLDKTGPGNKKITPEQEQCQHPRTQRKARGNKHGTGIFCGKCGLRLSWKTSVIPPAAESPTVRTTPANSSTRQASPPPLQPAPPSSGYPAAGSQEDPYAAAGHTPIYQHPELAGMEGGVDMRNLHLKCKCGRHCVRWVTARGPRHGEFFWRCPAPRNRQCDVFVWDPELLGWQNFFPLAFVLSQESQQAAAQPSPTHQPEPQPRRPARRPDPQGAATEEAVFGFFRPDVEVASAQADPTWETEGAFPGAGNEELEDLDWTDAQLEAHL